MSALYETHLPVTDLTQSIRFYQEVVGLTLAFHQPDRGAAFLWIGARENGMLGLWAPGTTYGPTGNDIRSHHLAFAVNATDLAVRLEWFKARGVEVTGFDGQPAIEPSVIGWMPAAQFYFRDPDGHLLEYITLLDESPEPAVFGRLSEWKLRKAAAT